MKKQLSILVPVLFVMIATSCKKDDSVETDSNCYVCSTAAEAIDVCIQDDGNFLVDGEAVENPNNASLEEYVTAIEANPNNDPALEGISCTRK